MRGDYGAEVRALEAIEPIVAGLVIGSETYILSTLAGREEATDSTVNGLSPKALYRARPRQPVLY